MCDSLFPYILHCVMMGAHIISLSEVNFYPHYSHLSIGNPYKLQG
jgi:hypothetical protein